MVKDFNNIKPWLTAKLQERGITTHTFARYMGTTSATVYRWYADKYRPTPEMMKRVCETLSRLPVKTEDGSTHFEEVPWSEGMEQYVPRGGCIGWQQLGWSEDGEGEGFFFDYEGPDVAIPVTTLDGL